jgi:hypothetical protein
MRTSELPEAGLKKGLDKIITVMTLLRHAHTERQIIGRASQAIQGCLLLGTRGNVYSCAGMD